MLNKSHFTTIAIFICFIIVSSVFFQLAEADAADLTVDYIFSGKDGGSAEDIRAALGLGDKDPREVAASVINIMLGFLGIIAVIIILYGGFRWMASAGNEENINQAKKTLIAGVIGLLIILSAFALSTFVIQSLLTATT